MRRNEASLNTGQPPGGVELGMLQSLRSYKSRLEYTYQYQPLQAVQQIASETALENAVGFFDTGLRHIISRDDLEDRVAGELSTGNPKALVYLQSLCKLLSQLVNIDLLSPDSILHNEPQDDPYSNFSALLKRLATSSWPFELVTGQKNKLFRLAEEPVAKDARDLVDKFNAFLDRFSRPSLSDMPPSQPVAPFTDGLEKEELRGRAITALSTLFSHIPLDCSVGHKVLVRLPDWDSMEPNRTGSSGALDLFLSTCDGSLDWQPTECHVWSPGDEKGSRLIDEFCEEIQDAQEFSNRLHLAALDKKMFVFRADDRSGRTQKISLSNDQPKMTLHDLITNGSFVENWSPGISSTKRPPHRFSSKQKRFLAAKLALSLSIYLASGHTLRSWDAKHIYFLFPKGRCDRGRPYALCVVDNEEEDTKELKDMNLSDPIPVFDALARLLMEIEFGCVYDKLPRKDLKKAVQQGIRWHEDSENSEDDDSDDDDDPRPAKMKDLSRIPYLRAVQTLLNFRSAYREQSSHLTGRGLDFLTITRIVIHTEVAGTILKTIQPAQLKYPPLKDGDFRKRDEIVTIQTSDLYHRSRNSAAQWTTDRVQPRGHHDKQPGVVELFDDIDEIAYDQDKATKADFFFQQLDKFHTSCESHAKKLMTASITLPPSLSLPGSITVPGSTALSVPPAAPASHAPIRIAILDTGIDKSSGSILGAFAMKRLQKQYCQSWVGDDPTNVHDTHGHGTNTAGLLLEVAPHAEIYVAKVFSGSSFGVEEAKNVAKAIRHAIKPWNVDIITMSFGLKPPAPDDEELIKAFRDIEKAIDEASSKILFAAAANHGSHAGRTFPANCRNVICIHASDGKGKDGGISPDPEDNDDNFTTLGIALPFTDAGGISKTKSGTSYATPIAAAMAADMLYIAESLMKLTPMTKQRIRTGDGMRKLLRLMCKPKGEDGYRFLTPWVKLLTEDWHRNQDVFDSAQADIRKTFIY